MNWREKLKKVAEVLGLTAKLEAKTLSNEEFQQIMDAYQRDYQVTLQDDVNGEQTAAANQQLLNTIYQTVLNASGQQQDETAAEEGTAQQTAAQPVSLDSVVEAINGLGQQVHQLAQQPAADQAVHEAQTVVVGLHGFGNTPEYLFGVQAPMYSMSLRWNKIAANPGMAAALGAPGEDVEQQLRQAVGDYGRALMARARYLQENKMTADLKALQEGQFSTTYAPGVANLGDLATQFVVRRQDAIIGRVLAIRRVTDYFPVRYGIQDNDIIFNAFFGEVSQAWKAGEHYKGSMQIENERGYVDDAMIKLSWGPMKELERKYIAYLNTSGSDPIKWNMVEFMMLNSLLEAQREQNIRRMIGCYVHPAEGMSNSYLNASTGIIFRLLDYVHSNKLMLTDDADKTFRSYTESTMLSVVKLFVDEVRSKLTTGETLDNKKLYLNENHKPWWLKCIRTQFHLDTDFSGVNSYANIVPDTQVEIVWLPYLGSLPFMMIQEPGNLQFLEYLPGEMMGLKVEQQMELVRAWSTWKEGTSAAFLGRKFASKALMEANAFKWQQVFLNKFCKSLAKDAVKADAANGFWFETIANDGTTTGEGAEAVTTPPAITDIDHAEQGHVYIIECGSTTNATTIAKSGKFSEISAAWEPSAVGDYLMVVLNAAGTKFAELERCVGGTRTINYDLNPHYVG